VRSAVIILVLISGLWCRAQSENYFYIKTSTELYATEEYQKPIGIFARGAKVLVLDVEFQSVQVRTNTGLEGYVTDDELATGLNGKDKFEEDPEIFTGGIDGQNYKNKGLYTNVAGLRARAQPSASGLVIKQLNMNHRCDVDFIPYDPNGWVCGGKVSDGEGYFTFFVPAKYVGKQTDLAETILTYRLNLGKSEADDKKYAERILEMSHWENDSLRLVSLNLFINYVRFYSVAYDVNDIQFEIQALGAVDFHSLEEKMGGDWAFYYNDESIKCGSEAEILQCSIGFEIDSVWPANLGECGWDFYKLYYSEGINIINEGEDYGISVWEVSFSNHSLSLLLEGFEVSFQTTERNFLLKLGHLIYSHDFREGAHKYRFLNGDAGFYTMTFEEGKPISWVADYYC
jgi:hypothetical protein